MPKGKWACGADRLVKAPSISAFPRRAQRRRHRGNQGEQSAGSAADETSAGGLLVGRHHLRCFGAGWKSGQALLGQTVEPARGLVGLATRISPSRAPATTSLPGGCRTVRALPLIRRDQPTPAGLFSEEREPISTQGFERGVESRGHQREPPKRTKVKALDLRKGGT